MSSLQKHTGVERAAAMWVARLTSGHANEEDVKAARHWCELSADHKTAFERARKLWRFAGPQAVTSADGSTRSPRRRRHFIAAAAALVLSVCAGFASVQGEWTADYRTAAGEQRRILLDDGSAILLDSASAVDVKYSSARRTVRLRKGEALFEVAHDSSRPFVVESERTSATAVGTVYSVRRDDDATVVVVKEGVVAVEAPGLQPARVEAGESLVHTDDSMKATHARVDTSKALAWERKLLVFELEPLEHVVSELNRHRAGYVVIAGRALRNRKVSGVFHLDRLDDSLGTLETAFGVHARSLSPYLVVLY